MSPARALTIGNSLTLNSNSTINLGVSSSASCNSITGLTNIAYGGTLNFTAVGSPAFAAGQVYQLFSFSGTESGSFAQINDPTLSGGLRWSFDAPLGQLDVITSFSNPKYVLALTAGTVNAHVGAPVNLTTTITNLGGGASSDSFDFTGLGIAASSGTIGGTPLNGTGVALNSSSAASQTYTNATPGTYTITAAVGSVTGDNGTTASQNGSSGTASIHFYSGQATWSGLSSTNWNDYGNWDGVGGVPGICPTFPTGDTAAFGTTTAGTATVYLNGTSPSITTLSFSSASSSYTLAQGSGGTLTMAGSGAAINVSGTHSISAPLVLASNTTVATAQTSNSFVLSGPIGDGGAGSMLTVTGPGLVTVSASNTYSGGTSITTGANLQIGSGGAAGTVGSGAVANNGTLLLNRSDTGLNLSNSISGAGVVTQSGSGMFNLIGHQRLLGRHQHQQRHAGIRPVRQPAHKRHGQRDQRRHSGRGRRLEQQPDRRALARHGQRRLRRRGCGWASTPATPPAGPSPTAPTSRTPAAARWPWRPSGPAP